MKRSVYRRLSQRPINYIPIEYYWFLLVNPTAYAAPAADPSVAHVHSVGSHPFGVALTPDGSKVFCCE
jgi:hypothetical protein